MKADVQWIEIVERKQSVLFASLITKVDNRKYCVEAGIDYEMRDYKYVDGKISFSSRDMNSLFGLFFNKLHEETEFLPSFANDCYARCDQLIEQATKIKRMGDLKGMGRKELLRIFSDYSEKAFKLLPYLYSANVIEILLHQEITGAL